jgi:hypothetical protein
MLLRNVKKMHETIIYLLFCMDVKRGLYKGKDLN